MRIVIDTNVILDIFQKREPFFADSYQALRKSFQSAAKAKETLEQLSQLVTFADVQGMDVHTALMRSMPDFEDAVVNAVAERNGASYILTRNIKDFAGSIVPAITPTAFLNRQ